MTSITFSASSVKTFSPRVPIGRGSSLVDLELDLPNDAPFSSRKRTFKGRELVEPATRQEMMSYLEEECEVSEVDALVDLQRVVLYFPKKNVFHLLQNRLINDLLLWKLSTSDVAFDSKSSCPSCTEGFPSASDKEELTEEIKKGNVHEPLGGSWKKGSKVSFDVKMEKLVMRHDTLDSKTFALALSNFRAACVPCYREIDDSWYLSIQSEAVELGMKCTDIKGSSTAHRGDGGCSHEVLTRLVQVSKDSFGLEETRSSKEAFSLTVMASRAREESRHYKVACMLRNCILHYLETPDGEQWWPIQLAEDLCCVIQGNAEAKADFTPSSFNRTCELHLSLGNCAVEYKPPSLTYHLVLMAESAHFSCGTNLASRCYEISLYMEDVGLFLSGKIQGSKKIDLRKDFVCVADINSLDIVVKQAEAFSEKCPRTKATASVNRLNIRTCSDSFAALSQIIIQLANTINRAESKESDEVSSATDAAGDIVMEMTVESEDKMRELLLDASNDVLQGSSTLDNSFSNRDQTIDYSWTGGEKPIINTRGISSVVHDTSCSVRMNPNQIHCSTPKFPHAFGRVPCLTSPIGQTVPRKIGKSDEKLHFVEDYCKRPTGKTCSFEGGGDQPTPEYKYHLYDTSITWFAYGGRDFGTVGGREQTRSGSRCERRHHLGIPWNRFCGSGRNRSVLVEFRLNKIQALHELYPEGLPQLSRDVLFLKEFEILDRLEISEINKFLHPYSNEHAKPVDPNMFRISARYSRDKTNLMKSECALKVSLMPFKLNIDQHSLAFLCEFINEVADQVSLPTQTPPKMRSRGGREAGGAKNRSQECEQVYFRSIKFSPETIIKIDYRGKMMDKGSVVGFLTSILQVNQSQIVLKRVDSRRGMRGLDKVFTFMIDEWINDIKTNQIPTLVKSIAPMGTLINIAQGVKNLFFMPVEQYKKDGRVVMGLQKGAYSFAACTLVSSLDLVYKSFHLIQSISQFAHDVVTYGEDGFQTHEMNLRIKHPEDLREGFAGACAIFKEGLNIRAAEVKELVSREHHQKGVAGAIGGVLRQVPQTVIDPILLASKATTQLIEGARNQLLPDVKKEEMEKWKTRR